MPRSKQELKEIVTLVSERYEAAFGEPLPLIALTAYVQNAYYAAQEELFKKMLGHLPPSDVAGLREVVNPVRPPEPPPPPVSLVKRSGKKEDKSK